MRFIRKDVSDDECKQLLCNAAAENKLPFDISQQSMVKRFCEGGQSLPLNVDNRYVVRFPREGGEQTWLEMQRESLICSVLRLHSFNLPVSDVKTAEYKEISFAYHQAINGKTMDILPRENNIAYNSLSVEQKNLLATDLALFLVKLHQILPEETVHIPKAKTIDYLYDCNAPENSMVLAKFGIDYDRFKTSVNDKDKVFCHNDLHGRNMAFDEEKEQVLMGIFDFGMAGFNQRSADFVKLCTIDRNLARLTVQKYNELSPQKVNMKEVDYQFLNWTAQNLRYADRQPKENREKFVQIAKFHLTAFRLDTLKEKIERPHKRDIALPQQHNLRSQER